MRNEDEFKRLFIENIADPNFRLICIRKQVFCIPAGLCVPGKGWIISWILWRRNHIKDTNLLRQNLCRTCVFSRSTSRDDSLIIVQSIWCQTHHSWTDQMRTLLDEHELISPIHLSSPELINQSSHNSLLSPSYRHRSVTG